MPRRGTNIYKRKDGRWEGRIPYEHPSHQKKYHSVYGKTYQETKQKMEQERELLRVLNNYEDLEIKAAAEIWLTDRDPYLKVSTIAAYRNIIETHIIPQAGNIRVTRFTQIEMERFAAGLRSAEKGYSLSLTYSRSICALLLTILSYARKKYGYHMQRSYKRVNHIPIPGMSSGMLRVRLYDNTIIMEINVIMQSVLFSFHKVIKIALLEL